LRELLPVFPHVREKQRPQNGQNARLLPDLPQAVGKQLIDADMVEVIYLVANEPSLYHENAVASNSTTGMTRYAALRKMFGPLGRATAQLA
ncbi:MAG: hypothetical protein DRI57_27410, partial [Deltaproteobacteria bacterium]